MLSIGRRANCAGIGLKNIGVAYDRSIPTDALCRTNVPGVYAIGDVNGRHMLAHTAYREAEVAINTILGKADYMRYHANPSVIYTQPEIASVGMTEEACKAKGIDYEVSKLSMRYSGRFVAENEGADGLCKIIIDRNLKEAGWTRSRLLKKLGQLGTDKNNILLFSVNDCGETTIIYKEEK